MSDNPAQHADTVRHYCCPTCGATKKIRDPFRNNHGQFPASLPCGWRGCPDRAIALIDGTLTEKDEEQE